MKIVLKKSITDFSFFLLFAAEFTFYLLILQTGIVEYHHSEMSEIWMVPVGGILGIISSIFLYKMRQWLIPVLLFCQLLLSINYASENMSELFLLGLISGITAPLLIARINHFWIVVAALALSYAYGTYYFDVPALDRTGIALFLSVVALFASLFSSIENSEKSPINFSFYTMGSIFLWLLLDATLFETLSRDSVVSLWGKSDFTWNIIVFHLLGLVVAYKAREWKHNNVFILALFVIVFTLYSLAWQESLSMLYPFVISYYNVILLKRLIQLPYVLLAVMTLSLWLASGMGLLVALNGSFSIAWIIVLLLAIIEFSKMRKTPLVKMLKMLLPLQQRGMS